MKPKLKPDVYWVPTPDGAVFVHSAGNLPVRGRSALPLMDRLAAHLDGSATLDELVTGLSEVQRDAVTTLVTALHGAGLVKDADLDAAHDLDDDVLATYAAELAYVDYFTHSAGRRFQDHRQTPVACVGSGLTLTALVHACLRSGVRTTTAFVADECPTDLDRLAEHGRAAAERDGAQRLTVRPLADLAEVVGAAGIVLHVSDVPMAERARDLDRLCRDRGIPLVQAVLSGDEAWIGPVGSPDRPGWESAWRRRQANLGAPDAGRPSDYLAGPTAAIVASRVSFLAFRHLTGIVAVDSGEADPAGQDRQSVTRLDLETLHATVHRFHPHPVVREVGAETEAEFADRYAAFAAATAPDGPAFSAAAAGLYDAALGLFAELDEENLPQVPLYVSAAAVSDPFGLLDASAGPVLVRGHGADFAESRGRGGLAALCAYAALAVDRRRLGDGQRAYAQNLVLEKPEPVDAAVVHPALAAAGTAAGDFRRPLGLAAGRTAEAALTRALLDHCVALTVAAVADATPVPVTDLPLDQRGTRYAEMLAAAGLDVEVLDVTGPLGVPVYAIRTGGRTVTYAAGCEPTAGLERVLVDHQGVAEPGPAAPAAPDPVGPARAAAPVPTPSWQELTATLHRHGYQVHAVPAGHDPVLTAVHPVIVQVAVHA